MKSTVSERFDLRRLGDDREFNFNFCTNKGNFSSPEDIYETAELKDNPLHFLSLIYIQPGPMKMILGYYNSFLFNNQSSYSCLLFSDISIGFNV